MLSSWRSNSAKCCVNSNKQPPISSNRHLSHLPLETSFRCCATEAPHDRRSPATAFDEDNPLALPKRTQRRAAVATPDGSLDVTHRALSGPLHLAQNGCQAWISSLRVDDDPIDNHITLLISLLHPCALNPCWFPLLKIGIQSIFLTPRACDHNCLTSVDRVKGYALGHMNIEPLDAPRDIVGIFDQFNNEIAGRAPVPSFSLAAPGFSDLTAWRNFNGYGFTATDVNPDVAPFKGFLPRDLNLYTHILSTPWGRRRRWGAWRRRRR